MPETIKAPLMGVLVMSCGASFAPFMTYIPSKVFYQSVRVLGTIFAGCSIGAFALNKDPSADT